MASMAVTDAPTEAIGAAWEACLAAWDAQPRHDALMQLVAGAGTYAWLAGRYRTVLAERPGDAIATRQLDRLQKAAMATMFASATARPDKSPGPYRATMTVLAMFIIAIVVGTIYAQLRSSGSSADASSGGEPARIPATPAKK